MVEIYPSMMKEQLGTSNECELQCYYEYCELGWLVWDLPCSSRCSPKNGVMMIITLCNVMVKRKDGPTDNDCNCHDNDHDCIRAVISSERFLHFYFPFL